MTLIGLQTGRGEGRGREDKGGKKRKKNIKLRKLKNRFKKIGICSRDF